MVGQGHHRTSTYTKGRYLLLRARRHRGTTAPALVRVLAAEFGRRISRQTFYCRLAETPSVQACVSF
ncbi:hypothetical protein TNCV_2115011 [Trichonephila clavipes]|nr:hypothetical protein TNCV_2115011 [Trichonephila clavipes]